MKLKVRGNYMKLKLITFFATTLVAGCATPDDVKRSGEGTHYESTQEPKAVANCLTRNNMHSGGHLAPQVSESGSGEIEYALKDPRYNAMVFYAVITPKERGSSITAWASSPFVWGRLEPMMMKGC